MTNGIIMGSELGSFKAVSLSIGQAKKQNSEGQLPRFIVVGLKNAKSMFGKKQNVIIFEDDLSPEIFEVLGKYAQPSKDPRHQGSFDVSLIQFKQSSDYLENKEDWDTLLFLPGGQFQDYKLAKGPCYANDVDGKRIKDKAGNYVIKDSIQVFVQVKYMKPTENGGFETVYEDPFSLSKQGQRMEQRFFSEAYGGVDTVATGFDPLAGSFESGQQAQPQQQPVQQPVAPGMPQQPAMPGQPTQQPGLQNPPL